MKKYKIKNAAPSEGYSIINEHYKDIYSLLETEHISYTISVMPATISSRESFTNRRIETFKPAE